MKVKVPKAIRFLSHDYKVRFDIREARTSNTTGLVRFYYEDIVLDNRTMPVAELNQTFLHEFIHVIERHMGMKIEDQDIDRLAEGLADFLFIVLGIEFDWSEVSEDG